MTQLLQKAFAEIQKLPEAEQNAIAARILDRLQKDAEKKLINNLTSTEAVVWSPQTDNEGVKALSDLLIARKKAENA